MVLLRIHGTCSSNKLAWYRHFHAFFKHGTIQLIVISRERYSSWSNKRTKQLLADLLKGKTASSMQYRYFCSCQFVLCVSRIISDKFNSNPIRPKVVPRMAECEDLSHSNSYYVISIFRFVGPDLVLSWQKSGVFSRILGLFLPFSPVFCRFRLVLR